MGTVNGANVTGQNSAPDRADARRGRRAPAHWRWVHRGGLAGGLEGEGPRRDIGFTHDIRPGPGATSAAAKSHVRRAGRPDAKAAEQRWERARGSEAIGNGS